MLSSRCASAATSPLQLAALLTAVETPECPREHDRRQQATDPHNEDIGYVADVELPDVAHKKISDRRIQRAPQHVDRQRKLLLDMAMRMARHNGTK
jgi:hypothetical protein